AFRLGRHAVVDHDHLVAVRVQVLPRERRQAAPEELRPPAGRHHHRDPYRAHSGFFKRKGPMTSASSGVVQKLSSASRGVQTMGSPRVLKEVLTRTGTPVRAWNAFSR